MICKVLDDLFDLDILYPAVRDWPSDAQNWVAYHAEYEQKQTLNDWREIPRSLKLLLGMLLSFDISAICQDNPPPIPDTLLWGAGLHEMGNGQYLDLHLDSDGHPLTGMERRINALLYLTPDWHEEWGGKLEFWQVRDGKPVEKQHEVVPQFGRVVLFAPEEGIAHGVPEPLCCPETVTRKSLSVFWWGLPRRPAQRSRALFLPRPHGKVSNVSDAERQERAGLLENTATD